MSSILKLIHLLPLVWLIFAYPGAHCAKTRVEQNVCQKQVANNPTTGNQVAPLELFNRLCFNIELPYETIVLPDYVPEYNFTTSDEVVSYMNRWKGARLLPKCWPHIQVALCSILMPRYHEDHLTKTVHIHRPSVEMCNDVVNKNNCQFIGRHFGWPRIFHCNDTNLYARNCSNELREIKPIQHNPDTSTCLYPLVASSDSKSWFRDVKGCSMNCKQPVFSQHEQRNLAFLVKFVSLLGLVLTSLAMILFEVNHNISKTSQIAIVIKQCNIYKLLGYLGWSLQLLGDLACNPDGSALTGLPLVSNACLLSFSLIYISSNLFLFWFMYLAKLCYLKLVGKNRETNEQTTKTDLSLNVASYIVVGILFVSVLSLARIDGHGLYGICVIGSESIYIEALLDFVPSIMAVLYANFYFITTILKLIPVEKSPRLKRNYFRIIALAIISILDVVLKVVVRLYQLNNQPDWDKSVEEYVTCSLNLRPLYDLDADLMQNQECSITVKPVIILYYAEVLSRLTSGVVVASWAFCEHNFAGFLRKLFDQLEDEKQKHKRVMRYLNANETYAENAPFRNQIIKDSYHDLVDMTSPTRTHVDDNNNNNLELDVNNNIRRFKSSEVPSSLGSVSLSEVSVVNRRHQKHQLSQNCRTSRDVVNEARRMQAADLPNIPVQPLDGGSLLGQFALLQLLANPPSVVPNLRASQMSLNGGPNIIHDMCEYK